MELGNNNSETHDNMSKIQQNEEKEEQNGRRKKKLGGIKTMPFILGELSLLSYVINIILYSRVALRYFFSLGKRK